MTAKKILAHIVSTLVLTILASTTASAGAHDDYVNVKDCAWWDLGCKIQQDSNRYNTKYPVVLVHGLSGFDSILMVEYFHQIPSTLRDGNSNVYVPNLSGWDGVEARGEQLVEYIQTHVLPNSGASKVNLIGHSMGSLTSRYVAGVYPELVASVTSVHGVNYGSHFADMMLYKLLPEDSPLYSTYIDFMEGLLNTVGTVIDFLASGEIYDENAIQASYDLSTQGNAELNAKYPAGALTSTCGSGPETASNGINYYSWGGIGGITNIADPLDYAMEFVGIASANGEETDGLVGRCSQRWGKVLRDDYNLNHTDGSNLLFGMTGFTDTKDIYQSHVSRLRGKNL